jgi:isochorismate synthase EntC
MPLLERQDGVRHLKVCTDISYCLEIIQINGIQEDHQLGQALLNSEKDRAEHIMLVDLARNDVNRVCRPETVKVDQLMQLEKFSHVIHITSQVTGILRDGMTRYVGRRPC